MANIKNLENETFNDVLTKDRLAIVKVFATWCGPCKFLTPHFERWSGELKSIEGVGISYYQADNDKCLDLVYKYGVKTLPTIMILVHGAVIYKLEGITRQVVMEKLIKKALDIKIEYKENDDEEDICE